MEQQARPAWTDKRLDDLSVRVDAGFERIDRRFEHIELEFREVRSQIDALRQTMIQVGGGMLIGFISVLAAILARGA